MAKMEPCQRTLLYTVTPSSGAFDVVLDVAKDLSAVNRRLYRQGMQYHISNIRIATGKGTVFAAVSTAGDTWMVHNAWKKGFRMWRDQRNEATNAVGIPPGKWEDFKIDLWDGSSTPLDSLVGGDAATDDEWALSKVFWDDDGTEQDPTFCLIGATNATTKIGLIQEYHISRPRPDAFNPDVDADASDSIFAKMLPMQDELTDELIGNIEDDNDNPPYNLDEMVGGDTVGDEPIVQTMILANSHIIGNSGPFTAECGLIRLNGSSMLTAEVPRDQSQSVSDPIVVNYDDIQYVEENDDSVKVIEVTVTPGPYRGVLAVPMGQ